MHDLEIRLIKNTKELDHVIKIRKQVFVGEQHVPLHLEVDGLDSKADHVIVYYNGQPIGCARIRTNDYARLERVAILNRYRNKGFGTKLMEYLIEYCKRRSYPEIRLHAQVYLCEYYKKFGFDQKGKPFLEAGIEHVEMFMKIRS